MKLSNQPPKGTTDLFPEDFAVRKYIFDTWRSVCVKFGYEEYLTPIVELASIYKAKSGEDVGGKELTTFKDRAGRELAIRPEMTPSVTRMVSQIYQQSPKPIRYFSIANFFRNEKPQRGRAREFWQLNYDIFGSRSISADIEILQVALEIMLAFEPPKDSFKIYINNRSLIDYILDFVVGVLPEKRVEVVRVMDKWDKISDDDKTKRLSELTLGAKQINALFKYMSSKSAEDLLKSVPQIENHQGFAEVKQIIDDLSELGYGDFIQFNPAIIRGFDYYDGMVFEAFDLNPENNRAMFGGGRYNGLASIFGSESFPAVGSAPGELTLVLFLESWGLLNNIPKTEDRVYVPLLDSKFRNIINAIGMRLRQEGKNVEIGLDEQRLGKALDYANKKNIGEVVIFGEEESTRMSYKVKDMKKGTESEVMLK